MIRGIHHVAINTANLDRLVKFYVEGFGFHPNGFHNQWKDSPAVDRMVGVIGSAARSLVLSAGNCFLELFEYTAPEGRQGPPLRANDRGYTHFCVAVTDLHGECRRLKEMGMSFLDVAQGSGVRGVYGTDPDGNLIELIEADSGHVFSLDLLENGSGATGK